MASNCDKGAFISNILKEDNSDIKFESHLAILESLDKVLKCSICFEYFNSCMVTRCSHNYCSVCIRRYMLYKSQCPTCFQEAAEPDLRNNRLIDEVLRMYLKLRESLQVTLNLKSTSEDIDLQFSVVGDIELKKEPTYIENSSVKNTKDDIDESKVSCPVCYRLVSKERVNIHLDSCLKAKEREMDGDRRALPKLVYHLLSDKEIRKKLREHDLNTSGDRSIIIKRHKNFVTLYNANCDSLDPKPVSELVREIECQEIEEKTLAVPPPIQVHKKSDLSEIETEFKTYAKEHQSQFNSLMSDIQKRALSRTAVKQEVLDEDPKSDKSDSNDDTDVEKDMTAETSKRDVFITTELKESDVPKDEESSEESPSLLDGVEKGKIMQLNLLRKRKKGRVPIGNRESPKKK